MGNPVKFYEKEVNKIENKFSVLFKGRKPKSLYEPCSFIMQSGGKRLRPFLVVISNYAVSGRLSGAYNAAAAVELLHNFTLVHDDIMDNADKRRGRPTLHIKYNLSTAILAGDNLIGLAYEYLLKDCKDNDKKVLQTFTKGMIEVCEGQSMDTDFESQKKVTIPEYDLMISKKTAALAEMCCSIGAQIGGGNNIEIKALADYGKYLGMAFQYQDDLLDIMGDETEFGKTVGGDLVAGKKTYLFLRALEKAKGPQKTALQKVIKNKGIRRNQVKKYREIYVDLGVLVDAQKEIKKYTDKALKSLNKLTNHEAKEILIWLANALIKRNK
ncbi:MAG: polyprenyl synthetase family protein [Bacteroidetes bacterium]|nr:polyprenyl synthetase family protein [Bacteroidota bacterium]